MNTLQLYISFVYPYFSLADTGRDVSERRPEETGWQSFQLLHTDEYAWRIEQLVYQTISNKMKKEKDKLVKSLDEVVTFQAKLI